MLIVSTMGEKRRSLKRQESGKFRREWDTPSYAVIAAIDEWFELNKLEKPLDKAVDLDAIDRFFETRGDRSLSFEYDDMSITLSRVGECTELSVTGHTEQKSI